MSSNEHRTSIGRVDDSNLNRGERSSNHRNSISVFDFVKSEFYDVEVFVRVFALFDNFHEEGSLERWKTRGFFIWSVCLLDEQRFFQFSFDSFGFQPDYQSGIFVQCPFESSSKQRRWLNVAETARESKKEREKESTGIFQVFAAVHRC